MIISVSILLLVIGAIVFKRWYNSAEQKGKRGEAKVHGILATLPDDYYLLDDVVLATDRGTTQIDHVVVSRFGVFVIETKNYTGNVYGDDKRKEWTQIIPTNVRYGSGKVYTYIHKSRFYNPVKQTLLHLYEIKKNLGDIPNLKVVPIVVFVGNCNLAHVESNCHVVYDHELVATIRSYNMDVISGEDVRLIYKRLSLSNVRAFVKNSQHVRNIRKSAAEMESKVRAGICPKCGGQLVRRNGAYGSFWGCSNYPTCRYTTHKITKNWF